MLELGNILWSSEKPHRPGLLLPASLSQGSHMMKKAHALDWLPVYYSCPESGQLEWLGLNDRGFLRGTCRTWGAGVNSVGEAFAISRGLPSNVG